MCKVSMFPLMRGFVVLCWVFSLFKNFVIISYGEKYETSQVEYIVQWLHQCIGLMGTRKCAKFGRFSLVHYFVVLSWGFSPLTNLIIISYGKKHEISQVESIVQWVHQCIGLMGPRSCAKFGRFPLVHGFVVLCWGFSLFTNLCK